MQKEPIGKKPQKAPKKKWINPLRDRTRVIPFVVPTEQERMAALGTLVGEKWRIKKSLQAIIKDFDPIKKPQPGQNLYEREQDGQTFPLFQSMYRNHIDTSEEIIYLATFKCKLSDQIIRHMKKRMKAFFHNAKVKLHNFDGKVNLQDFDPMVSQNGQTYYDGAKMNFYFTKRLPKKCYSIAILTNLLIYNGDNPVEQLCEKWVFGLGSIKDRTSLISVDEIVKKGYGNKLDQPDYENYEALTFLGKVINHELCHTFGMRHCIYFTCLMNGTSGYEQAVKKIQYLCPICVRKLRSALNFDICQRYRKLAELGDEKFTELAQKISSVVGENK